MDYVNLYLIGDMHVVGVVYNLFVVFVDNYLFYGNVFGIDLYEISWLRVIDVNDWVLWYIVVGFGFCIDGVLR